jgi:hypothetical protein
LRIMSLLPTQTRRSEESESLQQFSTPSGLKRDEVRFVHILHFPSSLGTLRE